MNSHKEMWLKLDTVNRIMSFHWYGKEPELFDILNGLNTNNIESDQVFMNPALFKLFA